MVFISDRGVGGGTITHISSDPTKPLPFEVEPLSDEASLGWTFAPQYYPDRFPQTKDKELRRDGQQCGGEDVTIKKLKNREFHVSGVLLATEVRTFNDLLDHDGEVNLYSPIAPSGGMEALVKAGEVDATPEGFDATHRVWRFKYSLDLVSTGRDEYERGANAIVSAIVPASYPGP